MTPEILERETVHAGYLTVERIRVRLADGTDVWREVERHGDAAVVLPYDAERRCVLLVRQFRVPVFDRSGATALLEACAGMVEHEDAQTAARREALEELGVALTAMESIAHVWASPGVSTERWALFLAPYRAADRIAAGGGAAGEHENITVVEQSLAELAADAAEGRITDGKLLTLYLALRLRHPELFGSERGGD